MVTDWHSLDYMDLLCGVRTEELASLSPAPSPPACTPTEPYSIFPHAFHHPSAPARDLPSPDLAFTYLADGGGGGRGHRPRVEGDGEGDAAEVLTVMRDYVVGLLAYARHRRDRIANEREVAVRERARARREMSLSGMMSFYVEKVAGSDPNYDAMVKRIEDLDVTISAVEQKLLNALLEGQELQDIHDEVERRLKDLEYINDASEGFVSFMEEKVFAMQRKIFQS